MTNNSENHIFMKFKGTQTKLDLNTGKAVDRTVNMDRTDGERFQENTEVGEKMTEFATNIIANNKERLRDKS